MLAFQSRRFPQSKFWSFRHCNLADYVDRPTELKQTPRRQSTGYISTNSKVKFSSELNIHLFSVLCPITVQDDTIPVYLVSRRLTFLTYLTYLPYLPFLLTLLTLLAYFYYIPNYLFTLPLQNLQATPTSN